MNDIQITVREDCTDEDCTMIVRELVAANDSYAPSENYRDLIVVAHRDGELVGGLIGYTHWNWLFVKQLWVAKAFRQQGIGRSLMNAAEHEAHRRGCLHAHCDTFDFQALPFYQSLDYTVFGQLDGYPPRHSRYFLSKRNLQGEG